MKNTWKFTSPLEEIGRMLDEIRDNIPDSEKNESLHPDLLGFVRDTRSQLRFLLSELKQRKES